jgi:hypothetical protein
MKFGPPAHCVMVKEHDAYQKALDRLLRDLRMEKS